MIWHPQRIIETPDGFQDEPYAYTPNQLYFNFSLAPGQEVIGLPIPTDQDADFYLCSIAFTFPGTANLNWLGYKLRNGYGQYMSDDYLSVIGSAYAAGSINAPFSSGGFTDVFETPDYQKAGSILMIDVKNQSDTTTFTFNQAFELRGFKRYPVGVCN